MTLFQETVEVLVSAMSSMKKDYEDKEKKILALNECLAGQNWHLKKALKFYATGNKDFGEVARRALGEE